MDAIAANNLNVGGRTLEENGQEFVVRGRRLDREVPPTSKRHHAHSAAETRRLYLASTSPRSRSAAISAAERSMSTATKSWAAPW